MGKRTPADFRASCCLVVASWEAQFGAVVLDVIITFDVLCAGMLAIVWVKFGLSCCELLTGPAPKVATLLLLLGPKVGGRGIRGLF